MKVAGGRWFGARRSSPEPASGGWAHRLEERFALKSTFLCGLGAAALALWMPIAASGQIAKEKPAPDAVEAMPRYQVYVGYGYTSLNQVNQSENGLQGVQASVTRYFGRYFGVKADGGHYAWTLTHANPQPATVDMYLAGPIVRAPLFGKWSGFVEGLFGAEHTGGVVIQPSESFAGGFGVGVDYSLGPHLGIRMYGDDIGSAFTVVPYQTNDSPHVRFNARASIGMTYSF